MFFRLKGNPPYQYLQIVENHREGKRVVQRVIATLGRADRLQAGGDTDALVRSLARYAQNVKIIDGQKSGRLEGGAIRKLGPDLVFSRLWQTTGIGHGLGQLLAERRFDFPVERAVYLTVLHRLFQSGSDRRAEQWRRDVVIPGAESLELHHLYRAMRWLGDVKDQVEELLFSARRDLFTEVTLAFFDTTTLYFHGQGGQSLGQYGNSKDHRPDLRQIVVGAVLTEDGRPIASEMWPGNHADANALLPAVDRLKDRFGIKQVCWVADRGMISAAAVEALDARGLDYILGARMRRVTQVRDVVLARAGRYQDVDSNLRVKEVWTAGRRYIVCYNPDEAKKDAADRQATVASLEDQLQQGTLHLVGNRGYRRFLKIEKGAARVDPKKVADDARYDGKFVLLANTPLPADEVAVQYKRLLLVERFFRAIKSVVDTRPIYHRWDSTIRGHVFCSFLALVLLDELARRFKERGFDFEWESVKQDLEALGEMEVREDQNWYLVRSALQGVAGKTLQAAGVAVPPPVRPAQRVVPKT